MTRNIHLFLCITEELRYICFKFSGAILAAILGKMSLLNWPYWFLNIWTSGSLLHMNRHFICLCIWNRTNTLDSNFWRPRWPPSWEIEKYCYLFLQIWTLRPLFHMNRHFLCLYIWKQSWDTLDSNFRRPSWLPSWKIYNCCYWFLHIWTVRPLFDMNRHLLLLLLLQICSQIEVPEHSNCRLVPYWREFLGVSGSRTWSDTPFANT